MTESILIFFVLMGCYKISTRLCQNFPSLVDEVLDIISFPVRKYRKYKFPDTLARVNQFEGKEVFWASLPRRESMDSNLLPEHDSKLRAGHS